MAAQGKNTGLQVGLIIAVVVALIATVAAFIFYRNDQQTALRLDGVGREKANVQQVNETLRQELSVVKSKIGATASDVGLGADPGPGTVLGQLNAVIARTSAGGGENDLIAVAESLRAQLDAERTKLGEQAVALDKLQDQYESIRAQYDGTAQEYDKARGAAVADLADVQNTAEENLQTQITLRRQLEDQLKDKVAELEEVREAKDNRIAELRDQNEGLVLTNNQLTRKIEDADTRTFYRPSGYVVSTENRTNTVYVDLGRDDNLRPGVTFAVYDKNKVGPDGADKEAMKGMIEITSVDARTSQARVLDSTPGQPFTSGDPIHSPIWSPGRKGRYAFVGLIDLDGDGSYLGERQRLDRILEDNGAETSVYIDDDGNWIDGDDNLEENRPLDASTDMLVLADVPDPSEVPSLNQKTAARKMLDAQAELRRQATQNGVRTLTLKRFLESVGYAPKRRRYVSGEDNNFNTRRDGLNRAGDPDPMSATSGLYDPDRDRRRGLERRLPSNRFGGASDN